MCEGHHAHDDHHHAALRPHEEPVVLEIGGELGALIVYTEPALPHREIEISPAGEDERRSHKDVLERVVGTRSIYAAVFDRLPGGAYTLWYEGAARARGVTVAGGTIDEVDLAGVPAADRARAA
jgi:hypothetical protein